MVEPHSDGPSAVEGLPPRPDSETGEPFPPHAPGYRRADTAHEDDQFRERRLSRKPSPPEGMGPVIAWHRPTVKSNILGFIVSFVVVLLGATVVAFANGFGWSAYQYWQGWIVLVVVAYLMSSPLRFVTISAGADWLQIRILHPFRRTRQDHIKLYELIEIDGSSSPTGHFLRISDGETASEMPIDEWQGDRRIWDLMYNGILHSVAAGARINKHAVQLLHIDQTSALEIARQNGHSEARARGSRQTGKHRPES